ncbi:YdcF family protein [Rhizobium rhizogenes]|uniref:YdcF family protein n=1 Tax=Rhizobium rhizogenes TaxID=359 RepID=UPI00226D93E8|nr:YdcF family protein [Rhizobium rhizogenes]
MRLIFRYLKFAVFTVAIVWIAAAAIICLRGITMRYDKADIAVVFGNALYGDGTPKPILASRLDVAVNCYQTGYCAKLFVSGSIDGPGLDEAAAMQTYLLARGIPADRIIVDNKGDNTLATARNAIDYMREHQISRVMLVSQYYHLARAQLAFERVGASEVYGAFPHAFQIRDLYSSWREVPAFAIYSVRLALNPDSKPISFRPMQFILSVFAAQ